MKISTMTLRDNDSRDLCKDSLQRPSTKTTKQRPVQRLERPLQRLSTKSPTETDVDLTKTLSFDKLHSKLGSGKKQTWMLQESFGGGSTFSFDKEGLCRHRHSTNTLFVIAETCTKTLRDLYKDPLQRPSTKTLHQDSLCHSRDL